MSKFTSRAPDPTPSSPSPASGIRGAIDSLVQGSLVELFGAYGVAVAPLPRIALGRAPVVPEISAAMAFARRASGVHQPGRMTLSLPAAVLELMKKGDGTLNSDWARELANQLIGRVKNRLLQFSVRLEAGVSSSVDSKTLGPHLQRSSSARIYAGRTLRGEILATFEGLPDESQLVYLGPVNVPAEGDVILF